MNVTVLSSLILHQKLFWVCFTGIALTMVSCLLKSLESVAEWCSAILWTSVVVYAKGNFKKYILYIYYRHGDVQPAMWHRTGGAGGYSAWFLWSLKVLPWCNSPGWQGIKETKKRNKQKVKVFGKFKADLPQTEKWRGEKINQFEIFWILSSVTLQASEFVTDFWEWLSCSFILMLLIILYKS